MSDLNMGLLHAAIDHGHPYPVHYDLWLVALSYLVAAIASTTVFLVASCLRRQEAGNGRRLCFALGTVTMGLGVWTMHFVAMLALRLPVPISYDWRVTVASIIPAIVAGAVVLRVLAEEGIGTARLLASSIAVGAGIGAMHYTGMAAMSLDARMVFDPWVVILSFAIAVVLAAASLTWVLWIGRIGFRHRLATFTASGSVMGAAVSAIHYCGMWAVRFFPLAGTTARASTIDTNRLGVAITVAVLFIIGATLIVVLVNHRYAVLKTIADNEAKKFAQVLEAVPDGVVGVDSEGLIRFANTPIETLFHFRRDDLIGKPIEMLMPKQFAAAHAGHRAKYAEAPRLRRMGSGLPLRARRADGTEFAADVSLNYIALNDGSLTICSVRDVSEQAAVRTELETMNRKLTAGLRALEKKSDELRRLTELLELLHGCITEPEANEIISRLLTRLLPHTAGAVYLLNPSRNLLQSTSRWGENAGTLTPHFAPDDCWALRRGRLYAARDMDSTVQCKHVNPQHAGYLCVPMLAQGDILGILHVLIPPNGVGADDTEAEGRVDSIRVLSIAIAEQIGVALANLRLREQLRNQSIRDPLTGLYNRRFMEEALDREIARTKQSAGYLSLVAIDLDHFKQLNDSLGHEGGDLVLREIGAMLGKHLHGGELGCRLGGEELLVILPETSIREATVRAEKLRRRIEEMTVMLRGQPLRRVTASFGVAEYPIHGGNPEEVLKAADAALYRAKAMGRNRIVAAEAIDPAATGSLPVGAAL